MYWPILGKIENTALLIVRYDDHPAIYRAMMLLSHVVDVNMWLGEHCDFSIDDTYSPLYITNTAVKKTPNPRESFLTNHLQGVNIQNPTASAFILK